MPWVIFTANCEYRRPGKNICFSARASTIPQSVTRDFRDYAIANGKAVAVEMTRQKRDELGGTSSLALKRTAKRSSRYGARTNS